MPSPRGRRASCYEMSDRRKEAKLKRQKKKEIFPFMPLNCGPFIKTDFHLSRASNNCSISSKSKVHPSGNGSRTPPQNPRLTIVSYTILLTYLTPKLLSFKRSFRVSIHFSRGLPTDRLLALSPTLIQLATLSFFILSTSPNKRRTPSSVLSSTPFITPHSSLMHEFGTLSISS